MSILDGVEWSPVDAPETGGDLPHATHEGVWEFNGHRLRCYRLSDGRSIFHADDFRAAFGDLLDGLGIPTK